MESHLVALNSPKGKDFLVAIVLGYLTKGIWPITMFQLVIRAMQFSSVILLRRFGPKQALLPLRKRQTLVQQLTSSCA